MAASKISKDDTLVVKEVRSGTSQKGEWCFCKVENAEKITLWADNKDFKAEIGDEIEILDIKSVSVTTKKVGEKYYTNMNISALLKNKGAKKIPDLEDINDTFSDDDGDFI